MKIYLCPCSSCIFEELGIGGAACRDIEGMKDLKI